MNQLCVPAWAPRSLAAVGSALLLASLATRWIADGSGSTYAGYRLATVLRDGNVRPDGAGLVYWALLSVGLAAAGVAASAPFGARPVPIARALIGCLVVLPIALATVTGTFPPGDWAPGPWLALAGGLATIGSARLELTIRSTATSRPS